jgi:hypothetical protein
MVSDEAAAGAVLVARVDVVLGADVRLIIS